MAEPLPAQTASEALDLFKVAVMRAGEVRLEWADAPVVVRPNESLQRVIERSYALTGIGLVEDA